MTWLQEVDSDSDSESDFKAEPDALEDSSSSVDDASDFDGDDASDDEGSASDEDFGGEDSEGKMALSLWKSSIDDTWSGDDWDELERKAAKSDKKRETNGKSAGGSDSESDRPKKKKAASKSNGKPAVKAKGRR